MGTSSQRIVSLAPNASSILFAIGAGRELVGVTKWCKDVAPVGRRPQVGDCWKLDIREVMRLEPTLLIGSVPFSPKTVEEILKQPVPFLALNPRSLADIYEDIRTLGRLTGRKTSAESLIGRIRRAFKSVAARAARSWACPLVYSEAWAWSNPRIASPPWVAELIELAGGEIVPEPGARVSDEQVARAMPDIIILAWAATSDRAKPSSALRNSAWQNVPAVRNRRVFVIRDELLNTPGPPLIQGVEELFRVIHSFDRTSIGRA